MEPNQTTWTINTTRNLDALLTKAVKSEDSNFTTKSDFIREAVRNKLEKLGFLSNGSDS
jgi:Arc/MetJ-type ribon-helix-helix transcriptional regulator